MKKVFKIGIIVFCFSNLLVATEPPPKKLCTAHDLERKLFSQKELDRIAQASREEFAARMAAAGVIDLNKSAAVAQSAAQFDFDSLSGYFDGEFDLDFLDSDLEEILEEQDSSALAHSPAPSAPAAHDSLYDEGAEGTRGRRSSCVQPIPDLQLVTFENTYVIVTNIRNVEYPKPLQCGSCGKKFTTKGQYLNHVFRMPVTCRLCNRVFNGKNGERRDHFKSLCPDAKKQKVSYQELFKSYNDALKAVDGRRKLKN